MALRNYLAAFRNQPRTPPYLLFFVTARCDARCRHCFYWRATDAPPPELSLDEIEKVARGTGPLLQLTLTGGDAAQRDDLPEIADLFARHAGVLNVTIGTNGFRTAQVVAHAETMLRRLPRGTNLTVDLSLDGLGADHDYIRNRPGIFQAVNATFRELQRIKARERRLNLCIDITVSTFNEDKLGPLYDYVVRELGPDIINALYIRGEPREPTAKNIGLDRYRELCGWIRRDTAAGKIPGYRFFTDTLHAKDFILRDIIMDTVREGRFQYPCTAGRLTGVIYPQGDVAPCEMVDVVLGHLRDEDYDLGRIWTSDRARAFRAQAAYERCHCVHQCFLSNNILFNPALTPRLIAETARLKFARLGRARAGGR